MRRRRRGRGAPIVGGRRRGYGGNLSGSGLTTPNIRRGAGMKDENEMRRRARIISEGRLIRKTNSGGALMPRNSIRRRLKNY